MTCLGLSENLRTCVATWDHVPLPQIDEVIKRCKRNIGRGEKLQSARWFLLTLPVLYDATSNMIASLVM